MSKEKPTLEEIQQATRVAYERMDAEAQLRRKVFIKSNEIGFIALHFMMENKWKPLKEVNDG